MDTLEPTIKIKIQALVDMLHKMDCTLLGNKDNSWIMELLFKPGVHRYHLIEWMLSKLSYDIIKVPGSQNSEERMKNLQCIISDLGVCQNADIINGIAALKEQLRFWRTLVDIIWLKYEIMPNVSLTQSDEGIDLSTKKSNTFISEEFEDAYSCINEICKTVNIKDLFNCEVQLLSPDVQSKLQNISVANLEMSKIPNLQEFESQSKLKADGEKPFINKEELSKLLLSPATFEINQNDIVSGFELNQCEEELRKISADLQNSPCNNFQDAYEDLKPLIVKNNSDEFTDVGPSFSEVEPLMENLLQLKKSISKVVSSNSQLLSVNSELEELVNHETFNDESCTVFKLMKKED